MSRSDDEAGLRRELSEARFAIQRQLEVLRYPNAFRRGPPSNAEIIARLERQLKDIEETLANLEG